MKRIFLLVMLIGGITMANAQVPTTAAKVNSGKTFIAPAAINDLDASTQSVTNAMSNKLALDEAQKNGTFDLVKGFLEEKKTILGLVETNQAGYLSKFGDMQTGLFSNLKGLLGDEKFDKFLKMKPVANPQGNALSHLFY